MSRLPKSTSVAAAFFLLAIHACQAIGRAESRVLLDLSTDVSGTLTTDGATSEISRAEGKQWLRLRPTAGGNGELTLRAPGGEWDLSAAEGVRILLHNPGAAPIAVRITASNPDASGLMNQCRNAVELLPGEKKDFLLRLTRRPEDPTYGPFRHFYMYYKGINVRDNTIDPARVAKLTLSVSGADVSAGVAIADVRSDGNGAAAPVPFFPFIDAFGQYLHGDWPGKIYTDADFAGRVDEELKERSGWPRSKEWNAWGGWAAGPTLKATGFFHAAKHDGKWWLVDPEGKLFWSYGPTGVGFGGDVSPVNDRENWFVALPAADSPTGQFYREGWGATYMYYQYRWWRGFDVQRANLLRKYGPDYEKKVAELSHDRLHSWGFNTVANWSDPRVTGLRKTPYTVAIHYGSAMIRFNMPDVFDPGWEPAVRRRLQSEKDRTAGDPWNLGYFVDNERWFGWRPRAAAIGEETLKNPPERRAKIRFVELLKEKYRTVEALNAAWTTQHASWDALLEHRTAPDMKNAKVLADCGDFGMLFAERYFSVCRSAVKDAAPNNMYLGSRFFGHTDPDVVALAGKYCDVISYNIYDNPPDGRANQYAKIDKPLMSTEWGIESDPLQTPFRDAKLTAPTPAERAAKMTSYVERALRLPNLVGAHFFQYRDQPISGRPDGEATLRGFVNVADTPNFELVQANRRVAYRLYETRAATRPAGR